jgi:hypothetical protein
MGFAVRHREEIDMDIGFAAGPTGGFTPTGPVRPDPVPVRQAVPTDLASSQSVTASTDAAAARNDAARSSVTHNVISIDPATRELIYRTITRSGNVISQVPDPVQLQLAAYAQAVHRAVLQGRTWTEAQAQADLQV